LWAKTLVLSLAGHIMATIVEPPRHWQDWASWALGLWLVLSPWIVMFWTQKVALENAVIVGFLLLLVEVVTLSAFRVWEEWLNVILGAWLVVSPFVLGVAGASAIANFVCTGALVVALALNELREIGSRRAG
jgi:hypothetical protein